MCHNAVFGYNKNIWMAKKRYFHETVLFNSSKYRFKINASMFYKSTWVICKLICHFYKPNIIPASNKVKFNFISKWFVQLLICRIFKLLQ